MMLRRFLVRALPAAFLTAFLLPVFTAFFVTTGFTQDVNQEAMHLYNKGVQLLETGKGDAARQAFQTIVDKYPASAYAKLAHEGLDKPLVGSITFKDLKGISEKEVRKQFELANALLQVGRPFSADAADQARTMLAQIMIKRKLTAKDIAVAVVDAPNNKKAITLTVVR
jgi:hypothetical protein